MRRLPLLLGLLFLLPTSSINAAPPDLTILASGHGSGAADRFGSAVAILGDLNQDGMAEFAVSAPGNDTTSSDAGAVYIFYGSKTIHTASLAASAAALTVTGETARDGFGTAMASGDFNGNGVADLSIGAPGYRNGTGKVYLFFDGTLRTAGTGTLAATKADRTLTGEHIGDGFGSTLTAAGPLTIQGGGADLAIGTPGRPGSGLTADYYTGNNFDNYAFSRTDPELNFPWGMDSPSATRLPADGFSVRWKGYIYINTTDWYTLWTYTDDGVRLYVNGQLAIDDWNWYAAKYNSRNLNLNPGYNEIVMEYFEGGGPGMARLLWQTSTMPRTVIPADRLFSGTGVGAEYVALAKDNFASARLRLVPGTNLTAGGGLFGNSTAALPGGGAAGGLLSGSPGRSEARLYRGGQYLGNTQSLLSEGFEDGLYPWVVNRDFDNDGTQGNMVAAIDANHQPRTGQRAAFFYGNGANWWINKALTLEYAFNLAGVENATLTFYWAPVNMWAGHGISLDIWDGAWRQNVLGPVRGPVRWPNSPVAPADYTLQTVQLSGNYNLIDGFRVRFRVVVGDSYGGNWGEVAAVDDVLLTSSGGRDTLFIGPASTSFGAAVTAGDINADGAAEVAIGAPADGGGTVRIFNGAALTPVVDYTAAVNNITLTNASGAGFGSTAAFWSAAEAPYLIIGHPFTDSLSEGMSVALASGAVFLYNLSRIYGGGQNYTTMDSAAAMMRGTQPQNDSRFGSALSTGGDVNGLGGPDLLVGAPREDKGPDLDVGEARLYSSPWETELIAPAIVSFYPAGDPSIPEGASITFGVEIRDVTGAKERIRWSLDGKGVGIGGKNYTFAANYRSAGMHDVVVSVKVGNFYTEHRWKLIVVDVNGPPAIEWSFPPYDPVLRETENVTLSFRASDPDDEPLRIVWFINGTPWITDANTTTFQTNYTSAQQHGGRYNITVTVDDSVPAHRKTRSWAVTVVDVDRPPRITSRTPTADPSMEEGGTVDFSLAATDDDGDTLTVRWTVNGVLTRVEQGTASAFSFHANETSAGIYSVSVLVSDGTLTDRAEWLLTVAPVNSPPVITASEPAADPLIDEGGTVGFSISASDPDTPVLTVRWFADGAPVLADSWTYLFWSPVPAARTYQVKAEVSDGEKSVSREWRVTVNHAPRIDSSWPSPPRVAVSAGERFTLSLNSSDPDGDGLVLRWLGSGNSVLAVTPGGSGRLELLAQSPGNFTIGAEVGDGRLAVRTAWTVDVSPAPSQGRPDVTIVVRPWSPKAEQKVELLLAGDGVEWSGLDASWSTGDGKTYTGAGANHTYLKPGVYLVTVRGTDGKGRPFTADTLVTVPPPVAAVQGRGGTGLDFILFLLLILIVALFAVWMAYEFMRWRNARRAAGEPQ